MHTRKCKFRQLIVVNNTKNPKWLQKLIPCSATRHKRLDYQMERLSNGKTEKITRLTTFHFLSLKKEKQKVTRVDCTSKSKTFFHWEHLHISLSGKNGRIVFKCSLPFFFSKELDGKNGIQTYFSYIIPPPLLSSHVGHNYRRETSPVSNLSLSKHCALTTRSVDHWDAITATPLSRTQCLHYALKTAGLPLSPWLHSQVYPTPPGNLQHWRCITVRCIWHLSSSMNLPKRSEA